MATPEQVWDEQDGSLCGQFIESARDHDFRHARKLTLVGGEAIRGYGVGGGVEDSFMPTLRSQSAVFLCEDNVLRATSIPPSSLNIPSRGYVGGEVEDVKAFEIITPGYFSIRTKSAIVGYGPWGTFLGQRMHESQVNPWMRTHFFPEPAVGSEILGADFNEVPIEDIIEAHQAALALGGASYGENADITVPETRTFKVLYGHL